jgi:hypothetical protein
MLTELATRSYGVAAFWTYHFQFLTTLLTKLSVRVIFSLALWAIHFFTFNVKKIMKRVVVPAGVLKPMISVKNYVLKFLAYIAGICTFEVNC